MKRYDQSELAKAPRETVLWSAAGSLKRAIPMDFLRSYHPMRLKINRSDSISRQFIL